MEELIEMQRQLMFRVPHGHVISEEHQSRVVAAVGVIEETIEYLGAIGFKSWRPIPLPADLQLEELADILHFFLELIILSGFSWAEVVAGYHKKHAVNLQRYESANKGEYSWDDRGKKEGP